MPRRRISIIGTVGVPGAYGGFETLAENLVRFRQDHGLDNALSVYCSSRGLHSRPAEYIRAELRYVPLEANGKQSIPYDIWSMLSAVRHRDDVLLVLGVSGALFLPIIRLISTARIVTNIDGIEWRREKWRGLAGHVLRWSERAAVRWSHVIVTDNDAISDYVRQTYGVDSVTIPYGGDHARSAEPDSSAIKGLPPHYALALCRIEPENNVALILEAWSKLDQPFVFVGNWSVSHYGRELKARYGNYTHMHLLDPVYEPRALRAVRDRATLYVHGHSAGGTNPSLVEMMHFGIPVVAHGCVFNRKTTEEKAQYFQTTDELIDLVLGLSDEDARRIGENMAAIARRRYTWDAVGSAYFRLIEAESDFIDKSAAAIKRSTSGRR